MLAAAVIPDELLAHATPEELAAYEQALKIEVALSGPLQYAQYVSPWVEPYDYLVKLDELLVALVEHRLYPSGPSPLKAVRNEDGVFVHPITGERLIRKLAISMPPRHGKSTIISEHTPPWYLSKYPNRRVILTSYEAEFAASWGRKGRDFMAERGEEFGVTLDPEAKAASRWELAKPNRGGMQTAGAGGPITGKGAHLFIVDDPVKNNEAADSETERAKMKDWYLSTARTRLQSTDPDENGVRYPGVMVVLMTRWHEDDLLGWLLEEEGSEWHVLNLPAIAGPDDQLGRPEGAALCPALFPLPDLEEIKRDLTKEHGNRWWEALYQGRPFTDGSGQFKRENFRYWSFVPESRHYQLVEKSGHVEFVDPRSCVRMMTCDYAATEKKTSDWSVLATWDVTPERSLILMDLVRERLSSDLLIDWTIGHYRRLKPRYAVIESKTYGLTVMQAMLRMGFPVREGVADTDKVARAIPASIAMKNERIFAPLHAPWLADWEHEHLAFPNGTNDDMVDTTSYAAIEVTTGALSTPVYNPAKEPTTLEGRLEKYVADRLKKQRKARRGRGSPLGRWG